MKTRRLGLIGPLLLGVLLFSSAAKAQTYDEKLQALRLQFPQGAYYNAADSDGVFLYDSWTNRACTAEDHASGRCPSHYKSGFQCMGFSYRVSDLLFSSAPDDWGGYPYELDASGNRDGWLKLLDSRGVDGLESGDVVRMKIVAQNNQEHSLVIWKVEGDDLYCLEANYNNDCMISWNRVMTKNELRGCLLYIQKHPGYQSIGYLPESDETANLGGMVFEDDGTGSGFALGVSRARGRVTLPEAYQNKPVTAIGQEALFHNISVTALVLPPTVSHIPLDALAGLSNLREILLPQGSTAFRLMGGALFSADGKELLAFPAGLDIREYSVPEGVERLHGDALFVCPTLKKLTLPASLREIVGLGQSDVRCPLEEIVVAPDNAVYSSREGALYSADQTQLLLYPPGRTGTFSVPAGITEIGPGAFLRSRLTSVKLSDTVTRLSARAFLNSEITAFHLGNGLQTIASHAFDSCRNLRALTLPETVTELQSYALNDCPRLRRLTALNPTMRFSGVPDGESAVNECRNLTLWGYRGSTSQAFCRAMGIPFRALDGEASLPVTGDGATPFLWAFFALVSGGAAGALCRRRAMMACRHGAG